MSQAAADYLRSENWKLLASIVEDANTMNDWNFMLLITNAVAFGIMIVVVVCLMRRKSKDNKAQAVHTFGKVLKEMTTLSEEDRVSGLAKFTKQVYKHNSASATGSRPDEQ
jgi:hypothetical protein